MPADRSFLRRRVQRTRKLFLEPLESRNLLSVNPALATGIPFANADHAVLIGSPAPVAMAVGFGGHAGAQTSPNLFQSSGFGAISFTSATPLTLSSSGSASTSGTISSAGATNVYSAVANTAGTMTVSVAPSGNGRNSLLPQVTIYDVNGNLLASGSATSKHKSVSASFSATGGNTYYFVVGGVNSSVGSYTLNVSTSVPAPPPPPPPPPPAPVAPPSWMPGPADYAVQSVVTEQSASTFGGQVLVIQGTSGGDSIVISQSGTTLTVTTPAGSQAIAGQFAGIAVYGFGGGDTIRADSTVGSGLSMVVYESGTVANTISDAGMDSAYLYAGSGNDTLIAIGGGTDAIYGGSGVDSIWADSADTLVNTTAAETTAQSIHVISAFSQPTAGANITLQVDGQALPQPAGGGYTSYYVNNPLFAGAPQYNDIMQGGLDDCYFLAGLSALAQNDPGLVQQSIVALGDGSYAVRFYSGSTPTYWRVDAQLPGSGDSLSYAKVSPINGSLWAPLLEKAFAEFRSGQNSYGSLGSGWMHEAYTAVTGASYSTTYTAGASADALAQSMASALAANHAVTAGSVSSQPGGSPIVGNHAYNVTSVTNTNGTWYVTVFNPWGIYSTGNGGLVTMTSAQFQSWFLAEEICNA
jgi:hypothetical protein